MSKLKVLFVGDSTLSPSIADALKKAGDVEAVWLDGHDIRQPLRNAAEPHRRRHQPPRNTEQQREIAEHNAAIDAKRAEKKAMRKGKR